MSANEEIAQKRRPLVLVVGASRGIGRECAIQMASAGWDVMGWYRQNVASDAETKVAVEAQGVNYRSACVDVDDEEAVRAHMRELGRLGTLRSVIVMSGITRDGFAATMSTERFEQVIRTNLVGSFLVTRDAMRILRRSGGSIVLASSTSGLSGQAGQVNYSASKAGIIAMTQALAKEGAKVGIRVNAVAPGFTDTDMLRGIDPSIRRTITEHIPMGRIGRPHEVARVVRFLATDDSSYITGQVLAVDGGMTA